MKRDLLIYYTVCTGLTVALYILSGCEHLTGPDEADQALIDAEWSLTQADLALNWGHPDAYNVSPLMFNWRRYPGMVPGCGDYPEAYGCFTPRLKLIEWDAQAPTVIRHEAGHAILWKLHDERYRCYQHTDDCKGE